jgi:hypothetical protein
MTWSVPWGAHQVHVLGSANAGALGAESLGDLHREGAVAPGGADDQYLLPRPQPSFVAQALQGDQGRLGHHRRILEADVGRLQGQGIFGSHGILGVSAEAEPGDVPENLVTRIEARDLSPHGCDPPRQVASGYPVFRFQKPGPQAGNERLSLDDGQVAEIDGRRVFFPPGLRRRPVTASGFPRA